jgi:uncharacterized protein
MDSIKVIDADSHVYEVEESFAYLPKEFEYRRPVPITLKPKIEAPYLGVDNAFWLVDGKVVNSPWGKGAVQIGCPLTSELAKMKVFSVESQSLRDVTARVRDLDKAGVDIQVLYSSLFLVPLSEDDALETALIQSYNTWIAERCSHQPERLKWAAVLPLRQPWEAVKEISRVKDLGAVSLEIYGTAGDRLLHRPEFDPVWAAASDVDLPVCVHVGWSYPPLRSTCDDFMSSVIVSFGLPLLVGFYSFVGGGILDRFPKLKVGFLEGGAGWIPWFMERMDHYYPVANFFLKSFGQSTFTTQRPSEYRDRIYVTCEADETLLPQVIDCLGEDKIMVSEDMPHFEEREGSMKELERRSDISDAQKRKILYENPARFYHLPA